MLTEGMSKPAGEEEEGEEEEEEERRPKVEKVDRQAELEELQREADAPIDASIIEAVNNDDEEE